MAITDLISDGLKLKNDFSLLSLRTALKNYFATAKSMHYYVDFSNQTQVFEDKKNKYGLDYQELYYSTILNFHHYFELTLKTILRNENELLVLDIKDQHKLLYSLLSSENIERDQIDNCKTLEFSIILQRIIELKDQLSTNNCISLIYHSKETLKQLNILRNRTWHRGIYIINYHSFDELIGKYVLPLAIQLQETIEKENAPKYWKYIRLKCGLDPINEIISEYKKSNVDKNKIYILKEMGRASYNNNFDTSDDSFRRRMQIYEKMKFESDVIKTNDHWHNPEECPVCGLKTLIIETDSISENDEKGNFITGEYVIEVNCKQCGFTIYSHQLDPVCFGYDIKPYFYGN
jgi:hypothetical protein